MIIIKYYRTKAGAAPFEKWFTKLDATLRFKVTAAIQNLENGNTGNVKSLKNDLFELKIFAAGGLRIYFAQDGEDIILLLGGGAKGSQSRDIENARNRLADYLTRKEQ